MLKIFSLLLSEGGIYLIIYFILLFNVLVDFSTVRVKYSRLLSYFGCVILLSLLLGGKQVQIGKHIINYLWG